MPNTYANQNTMAGWRFAPADIADAKQGRRMLNVSLDLSNPCNLNCPYCYIEEKNSSRKVRLPGELTVNETRSVLEQFAGAGAKTVNLVGAGEPTIDPVFRTVVSMIVDFGMIPVVFTNGLRLANDVEMVDFLDRSGATVVLKYNAVDHHTQDLLAGRPGYTDSRNAALECLLEFQFQQATPTRLAFDIIAVRGNLEQIPGIHRYCRQQNILPILGDLIPTGRTENGRFVGHASLSRLSESDRREVTQLLQPLHADERADLYSQLKTIDESEYGIRHAATPAYYSGFGCTQLLGLYVDIRGNVWPCVARTRRVGGAWLAEPLGNIRRGADLLDLWKHSSYMAELRAGFSGGCPYKPMLGGTPDTGSRTLHPTRLSLAVI